jgi:hypothetical protein
MSNNDTPPVVPFLDQESSTLRTAAEDNALMELKRLQKKDSRYLDPMSAYKALREMEMTYL